MSIFRTTLIDEDSQRSLFEEMYLNYRKQMLLVARSVLQSDTDAEDVVHDVFLKIAQKHMSKISKVENTIDLRNYLLKATKHTALDHLRKRLHEKPLYNEVYENAPNNSAERTDDALVNKICNSIECERIVAIIASMDEIYREALYHHFVLEMSVQEVAKLLNCKVPTLKQRLVRGKKLLHSQLLVDD
jgi:RNA polymerase sigma factor, sigma-70 family